MMSGSSANSENRGCRDDTKNQTQLAQHNYEILNGKVERISETLREAEGENVKLLERLEAEVCGRQNDRAEYAADNATLRVRFTLYKLYWICTVHLFYF